MAKKIKNKLKKQLIALVVLVLLGSVFGHLPINTLSGFTPKSQVEKIVWKITVAPEAKADPSNPDDPDYDPYWYEGQQANLDPVTPTTPTTPTNKEPASKLEGFFSQLVGAGVNMLIKLEGGLLVILTRVLFWLMSYNDFVSSPAVTQGWGLIRDIGNLFFVLILLVIAIATILRLESYNLKRLLPKVLIMAVLVNFSRVVCGLIIDFAQVVMMTFAASFVVQTNNGGYAGEGRLVALLQVKEMMFEVQENVKINTGSTSVAFLMVVVSGLLAVFLLLVAIVVVLVMLVVIAMRIVMLWLLVVLSPLAFVMAAFPSGQRYSQQWWQEFTKYVIIGPILAFFLWLSFSLINPKGGEIDPGVTGLNKDDPTFNLETSETKDVADQHFFTAIGDSGNFLNFVIAIGMLMGGLVLTQQMGVAGGQFAGQASGWVRKVPRVVLGWANRKIYSGEIPLIGRFTKGLNLSPALIYQNYRTAMDEKKKHQLAAGQGYAGGAVMEGAKAPRWRLDKKISGIVKLALGSPQDAFKYYGGVRGIPGVAKYFLMGAAPKKLQDEQRRFGTMQSHIDADMELTQVEGIEEMGKKGLAEETAKGLEKLRSTNQRIEVISIDDRTGKIKKETWGAAEIDNMLANAKAEDAAKLGLSPAEFEWLDEEKQKGIKPLSRDSDNFMKAFYKKQGELLVEHAQIWYDDAGNKKQATVTDLKTAGQSYYTKEIDKANQQVVRLEDGGLTDIQMANRQKELVGINERMLEMLKQIKERHGVATPGEEGDLEELRNRGLTLGGRLNTGYESDVGGFWQHFSTDINDHDKEKTHQITHADIKAKRTVAKKDIEGITKEEAKEISVTDALARAKVNLTKNTESKRLANLAVPDRKKEQESIKTQAEKSQKGLREAKGASYVAPVPYYALETFRSLQREELGKLPDSMEWDEVEAALRIAEKDKDIVRFTTLLKKAAMDYNDNEFLNSWGYQADSAGMRKFGDEVLRKKLGMGEQHMLQLMNDIAYINEERQHYETSRLVGLKNGIYQWRSPQEHAAAVSNENLKKDPRRFLQSTNRLGYGGEDATGKYKLALSGKLTICALGDDIINRINRREINPTALARMAEDVVGLQQLVRKGLLSQRVVNAIMRGAATQQVSASYGNLYEYGGIMMRP